MITAVRHHHLHLPLLVSGQSGRLLFEIAVVLVIVLVISGALRG